MTPDRSATAWANDLPAGARVPWAELEARVFRGRPGVLAELGGAGAFQRRGEQARSPWFLLAMILAVLPVLALVLLPVLAFTALGTWQIGGETQSDDQGVQFTPASTFWIERGTADARPARGWKVAVGTHGGLPPTAAEIIRKVGADDDSMHGFDAVDFVMWS